MFERPTPRRWAVLKSLSPGGMLIFETQSRVREGFRRSKRNSTNVWAGLAVENSRSRNGPIGRWEGRHKESSSKKRGKTNKG